jgi:hypothetical protein
VRHSFEENESACFFTTVACITSLQAMARWMERAVESGRTDDVLSDYMFLFVFYSSGSYSLFTQCQNIFHLSKSWEA